MADTVTLNGKEIKSTDMPKNCKMIRGKWYTKEGLPKELKAYESLWSYAEPKQLGTVHKPESDGSKKKVTTPPAVPSATAQPATATEK